MICEEEEELYSSYEEADSIMFFHLDHIFGLINVVICADDTDCLVTALGCKHLFEQKVDIWLNNLCYINVNKIYNHLGETLCRAPSACHALTEQNTFAKSKHIDKVNDVRDTDIRFWGYAKQRNKRNELASQKTLIGV